MDVARARLAPSELEGSAGKTHPGAAQRKVQAGFLFALLCLAIVGVVAYLSVQRLRTNAAWVEHTHQVLTQLDRLLALTTDAETAERGYVITGDAAYLTAYGTAVNAVGGVQQRLNELTADNPAQRARLHRLNELVAARLAALGAIDEARRSAGFSAAQQLIQTGPGKSIHGDLRRQIEDIAGTEGSLLRERQQRVDSDIAITLLIGALGTGIGLAALCWAAVVSRRDFAERRRIEAERQRLQMSLTLQLEDMRRLHELSSRLIAVQEVPRMLEETLAAIIELQRADLGNIQLYDPESATLRIVAQRGFSQAFLDHFRVVDATQPSACGRALRKRARVIIEDVEADPEYAPDRSVAADAGYRAVQSTPIFAHDGAIKGMLSTHFREPRGLSERDLQMTDLYMRVAAELIGRAQDAESLRMARDEADRANRAKVRFLATASHDLRQPLQALSLLNGALTRLVDDEDTSQAVAQQQQAISAMSELLNALLDISKLETGAVKPHITDCEVAGLFETLRVEFSAPAARKGLRLAIAAPHQFARTDRTLLGQILRNLLSNAIRYTHGGSVQLQCDNDGEKLRIRVTDTGIGIAKEELGAIFEEFYQVGVAPNSAREGHGLGLNIVKRVAQLLDYELQVESQPGKGSSFSVLVPASTDGREGQIKEVAARPAAVPGRKAHILIVDDDVPVLDATRMLLKVEGYRVSTAASLELAAQKASEHRDIDLLVTDFHLSDDNLGTEVIEAVRRILGRRVHAVLITGDTSSAIKEIASHGDIRLTSKPIKADELLALIEQLTAQSSIELRAR